MDANAWLFVAGVMIFIVIVDVVRMISGAFDFAESFRKEVEDEND